MGTPPSSAGARPARSGRLAAGLVFAAAFALYALTRRPGSFSDALDLAKQVEAGPMPYYNALYLPLGWALHRGLRPLVGWDAYEALSWLSAGAGALSVLLLWRLLGEALREPLARLAWTALFALAPGVWFFATSVEVHALQLLCVTAATLLAWRAREAPSARAPYFVAAALVVAMVGHLTSVLLAPALVVLALGDPRAEGRGLSPRRLPWRSLLGALVAVVVAFVAVRWAFEALESEKKNPLEMLVVFGDFLRQKLAQEGLFDLAAVAEFLRREYVGAAGVLVACAVLGLPQRGDRRLAAALVVALVPYLVLLPQGGIREHGAYYLSLLPLSTLAAARALEARAGGHALALVLALALAPQAWLGWRAVVADGGGEDARVWAAEVSEVCPPGALVFTATLPRWHALAPTHETVDLWRVFEITPRSQWGGFVAFTLQQAEQALASGRRVFVDVSLFEGERPDGLVMAAEALAERFPRRAPVPPEAPLVVELLPG